jgi:hypothetical protein
VICRACSKGTETSRWSPCAGRLSSTVELMEKVESKRQFHWLTETDAQAHYSLPLLPLFKLYFVWRVRDTLVVVVVSNERPLRTLTVREISQQFNHGRLIRNEPSAWPPLLGKIASTALSSHSHSLFSFLLHNLSSLYYPPSPPLSLNNGLCY